MSNPIAPTVPTTFAQAEEVLAVSLPGYESRPQQQTLAMAVEQTLAGQGPPHLIAEAGCGCIQGDAEITVNRGGLARTRTLADLVEKFNGGGGRYSWDLSIPTYVQREAQDGTVRLGLLVNAWCSGVKTTYTVTTSAGRTLRATDEHPFLTEAGWKRLDELVIGDDVHVRGEQASGQPRQPKPTYARVFRMQAHPYANGFKNGSAVVPEHRLVAEAGINGLERDTYVAQVVSGDVGSLIFLDPTEFAVHHLDGNSRNNHPDNLKVLTHREHHQQHADEGASNHVLYKITTEKVMSVEVYGEEMTYDLEVADEPHNFLANGFVVHNTGKSLGYLIPAILSRKRVIVSTATKALQDQVAHKDLPFLAEHLPVPFTYALLKGRANYACFGGETKIMTRDGCERLDSIYDQTHEVLDGDGNWVKAEIKEFGQQRLYEVTLTRDGVTKVVRATAEHRWFVQPNANFEAKTEVTTLDLKPGDRMPFVAPRPLAKSLRPSRAARRWKIESVVKTDVVETVYCAVVPSTASFALDGNLLTGNCQAKVAEVVSADVASIASVLRATQEGLSNPEFLGERDDFAGVTDPEWRKITTNSEECPGKTNCSFGKTCFAEKAKAKAKQANVVVVNHALFLTDLKIKGATAGLGSMLNEYDAVIFDEAHEIEEYAGGIFGSQFSEAGVRSLSSEIRNFVRREVADQAGAVDAAVAEVQTAMAALWQVLKPGRVREANLLEAADEFINFTNALGDMAASLYEDGFLEAVPESDIDTVRTKRNRLHNRAAGMYEAFQVIVTGSFDGYVRWVETDTMRNGETRMVIKVAPISVAPILRDMLFTTRGRQVITVLTSATMAVEGKFDYIAGRLGIEHYAGLDVGTPFSYEDQSVIYVPRHLPEPTPANRDAWQSMAIAEMGDLVRKSQGRALLLFTSNKSMKDAYNTLASRLPYTCLMQGQMANKTLAEKFMDDTHSVLFATRSFMTGVDFQGEACSLVVVDKLPFPVPTEPLTEARCEIIVRNGGAAFRDYTLPVMTLVLKQAFGRLIRHRNDKGVVAILDPRLVTKGYGSKIMASLPPARRVHELEEITEFYAKIEAERGVSL